MGVDVNLSGIPNFDQLEIVKVGYTSVSSDGSTTNFTTVAHNLGFKPIIVAFLNNVNLSGVANGVDIPLPTYGSETTVTGAGNEVRFTTWIHAMVNATNSYFVLFNSTGATVSALSIKYYLLRQKSS